MLHEEPEAGLVGLANSVGAAAALGRLAAGLEQTEATAARIALAILGAAREGWVVGDLALQRREEQTTAQLLL